MELENIMPSEKSQAHKYKCCTISLAAAKVKLTKIESNCSCQGLGVGEVGRCWSQRTNIQLRDQWVLVIQRRAPWFGIQMPVNNNKSQFLIKDHRGQGSGKTWFQHRTKKRKKRNLLMRNFIPGEILLKNMMKWKVRHSQMHKSWRNSTLIELLYKKCWGSPLGLNEKTLSSYLKPYEEIKTTDKK